MVLRDALSQDAYSELIKKERRANSAWSMLRRHKTAMLGLIIACILVIMAVFSPLIATHDPNKQDIANAYKKPGTEGHLFGTDEYGRDLFSRIVYGSRISILVAIGSCLVGGCIGLLLGLVAGYSGGWVDSIIMRFIDGMSAFPYILLSILLMTIMGTGLINVIFAIGFCSVPGYARIVRGQVHVVKNKEFCDAIRVLGASNMRLILRHILPNVISPVIVYSTLSIAGSITFEATLSFLGIGITPPTASWGTILRGGRECLRSAPHIATLSGLFILITVIGFNLLGDGIRDVMDPKMKK